MEYAEKNNIAGALLMLDFRKAIDSVEHGLIIAALKQFGWVQILYNRACLNIQNNGWIGRKVPMNRGIRQGCPVSGLLILTVVEILAEKIGPMTKYVGFCIRKELKSKLPSMLMTLL